jgi:hypothetical protein
LPAVLYGCKTWSLILKEEHRLRVFKDRVLRRILGSRRDKVIGSWRKQHNEELHNLCSSPSIIRIVKTRTMRLTEHVARIGEKMNAHGLLVGKPVGKRPLGRQICRWVNNIRMELGEIEWYDLD